MTMLVSSGDDFGVNSRDLGAAAVIAVRRTAPSLLHPERASFTERVALEEQQSFTFLRGGKFN